MQIDLLSPSANVFVFDTPEDLARAAAERFVTVAEEAIGDHGRYSVALAGGRTPSRVYELLATESFRTRIDWLSVHLFFGDERCVPPDHPESNYGMVHRALISKVPIPDENIHRIIGEIDPEESAQAYEYKLKSHFQGLAWPRFDLVLLGMGEDGHTASLFPNSDALKETSRWVVQSKQQQTGQNRVTLTLPALNHAAYVAFLVTGKEKAARLRDALKVDASRSESPAGLVRPVTGKIEWLVDREAAALL